MKLKSVTTKFSVMIMAGVIALSGAGTVFAADSSGQADKNFRPQRVNFEEMTAIYQSALDKLVDEGTITQDQAEAVTAGMTTKAGITVDAGKKVHSTEHKAFLSKLVSDGKLTQEQADAITSSMPSKADMKNHDRGDVQSGDRPVNKLVSDGTITQEQLNAIHEAMKAAKDSDKSRTEILEELVSAGTVTQNQADAITSSIPVKNGTWAQDEKTAAGRHMGFFSKLVSDGTITQEQADAICSAVKEAMDAAKDSE
jgi:competence protein ComGC